MHRSILILGLGLIGAVFAYCCTYFAGTAKPRALMQSAQPELAWLQHEFNLGDAGLAKISELHSGYVPQCKERCRQIEELNSKLSKAMADASSVTADIETLLSLRAQIRASCQVEMLRHFFEVSRTMPPEQGKRYLAWIRQNTCLREQSMDHGLDRGSTAPLHKP